MIRKNTFIERVQNITQLLEKDLRSSKFVANTVQQNDKNPGRRSAQNPGNYLLPKFPDCLSKIRKQFKFLYLVQSYIWEKSQKLQNNLK